MSESRKGATRTIPSNATTKGTHMAAKRSVGIAAICATAVAIGGWLVLQPAPEAAAPAYTERVFRAAATADARPLDARATAVLLDTVEQSATSALIGDGASPAALAQITGHHLSVLQAGHPQRWLEFARPFVPPGSTESLPADVLESLPNRFLGFRDVRFDATNAWVEVVAEPSAFPRDKSEPGTLIGSDSPPPGFPAYRGNTIENATGVEVFIPGTYRATDGTEIPTTYGLRYVWIEAAQRWEPVRLFLYQGADAMNNKAFKMPVF